MKKNKPKSYTDLKNKVLEIIGSEQGFYVNALGRSAYDDLCESIHALSKDGRSDELVEIFLEIGGSHKSNSADWWLKFLGLFDEIHQLSPRSKDRLTTFAAETVLRDPESHAYMCRMLAYLGCIVPWTQFKGEFRLDNLTKRFPAVIADAFAWARDFTQAERIINDAFDAHTITVSDAKEMKSRWLELGYSPGSYLIKTEPQHPLIRTAQEFGKSVGQNPIRFRNSLTRQAA